MRPGRRSVTTSFLPAPHFSPRGEARTLASLPGKCDLFAKRLLSGGQRGSASPRCLAPAAQVSFCESLVCFFNYNVYTFNLKSKK